MIPSTSSPLAAWNAFTARCVWRPKIPSAGIPSACCAATTRGPLLPFFSIPPVTAAVAVDCCATAWLRERRQQRRGHQRRDIRPSAPSACSRSPRPPAPDAAAIAPATAPHVGPGQVPRARMAGRGSPSRHRVKATCSSRYRIPSPLRGLRGELTGSRWSALRRSTRRFAPRTTDSRSAIPMVPPLPPPRRRRDSAYVQVAITPDPPDGCATAPSAGASGPAHVARAARAGHAPDPACTPRARSPRTARRRHRRWRR